MPALTERSITYWPLASVVRDAAGIGEEPPDVAVARIRALLARDEDAELVADRVAAAIGLAPAAAASEEIFFSFRRLFEALAADRPLVVVFEDVHWAEVTLLDLVEQLSARIRDAPVLVVCTARPEFRETRPDWGGGELEPLMLRSSRSTSTTAPRCWSSSPAGSILGCAPGS